MVENVLPVTGSPAHAADQLDQLGVKSVHATLVGCLLTSLDDRCLHFLFRLVDDLLDAAGMDASVGYQLLQREPRDLAPHRIEAGDHYGVRRVIDDDVDAGGQLEGADVPSFPADDAALHLIIGKRDRRHRSLDALLRRNALDRQRDDFLRFTLRVAFCRLANLTDSVRGVGLRFFFHPMHQLGFGIGRGDSGELLEAASFFAEEFFKLLLSLGEVAFDGGDCFGAAVGVSLTLLEKIVLAIQLAFAIVDAPLLALDFLSPAADLELPLFTELDQLFLAA